MLLNESALTFEISNIGLAHVKMISVCCIRKPLGEYWYDWLICVYGRFLFVYLFICSHYVVDFRKFACTRSHAHTNMDRTIETNEQTKKTHKSATLHTINSNLDMLLLFFSLFSFSSCKDYNILLSVIRSQNVGRSNDRHLTHILAASNDGGDKN